jgi:hypothetical protein
MFSLHRQPAFCLQLVIDIIEIFKKPGRNKVEILSISTIGILGFFALFLLMCLRVSYFSGLYCSRVLRFIIISGFDAAAKTLYPLLELHSKLRPDGNPLFILMGSLPFTPALVPTSTTLLKNGSAEYPEVLP